MKSRSYMGFGLAVILALIAVTAFMADQTHTTKAAGGGPEMKLTVVDCSSDTCTVDEGGAFTLTTEVVLGPDGGYILAQTYIVFGTDLVYKPADSFGDEFVWTECEPITAVGAFWAPEGGTTADVSQAIAVNHGCLTGLIGPEPSTYVGTLLSLSFNCSAGASSTEIQLLPVGDDVAATNGAEFKDAGNTSITPKITNVTVNCGASGDTPVPTDDTPVPTDDTPVPTDDTPVPTPETPTTPPDDVCGDVNGDGAVSSVDSLWVLWVTADLIEESGLEGDGDVNGDGEVTSVDAALILQTEAGLIETPCV